MAQECPYCGAEMSDLDCFCTKCGLGTQAYAPADHKNSKKRKSKFRWWLVPLIIILLAALAAILFWSQLSLYFAPELQLVEAMNNTASDFSKRMEGSPLAVLIQSANWDEGFTTAVNMDLAVVGYEGFGVSVSSAVDLESNSYALSTHQKFFGINSAQTTYSQNDRVVFAKESADGVNAYNVDFQDLDQGLDSESFSKLTDEEIDAFRSAVEELRYPASSSRKDINRRYGQVFLEMLKDSSRTARYEKKMLEGKERRCGVISYSLNNFVLAQGLEDLARIADEDPMLYSSYLFRSAFSSLDLTRRSEDQESLDIPSTLRKTAQELQQDRDGGIVITFHLCGKKLVRLCLERQNHGNTDFFLDAELGLDTSSGDILSVVKNENGQKNILIQTEKTGNIHSDTVRVSTPEGTESIAWTWDPTVGDLPITIVKEGRETVLNAVLKVSDSGFTLELPDLLSIQDSNSITGMGLLQSFTQLDAAITVTRGVDLQIPEGKPAEEWSEKELKMILSQFLSK